MPGRGIAVLLLLLFLTLSPVQSVYIDDVGRADYHYPLLGIPRANTTFFHRPTSSSRASLLYTLSENGVIGAVNPKDGSIVWRRRVADQAVQTAPPAFLRAKDGLDVIIAGFDNTLKAFNGLDGRLVWSWEGTAAIKDLDLYQNHDGEVTAIALFLSSDSLVSVQSFAAKSGQGAWTFEDESGSLPVRAFGKDESIYYISSLPGLLKGSKLKTLVLSSSSGQVSGQLPVSGSESNLPKSESINFAGFIGDVPSIAWTENRPGAIKVMSLSHGHISTIDLLSMGVGDVERIEVHAIPSFSKNSYFASFVQGPGSHWAFTHEMDPHTGAVNLKSEIPAHGGRGGLAVASYGPKAYVLLYGPQELSVYSAESSGALRKWGLNALHEDKVAPFPGIVHTVFEVGSTNTSHVLVRSTILLDNGDWIMMRDSEKLWSRHEGLSSITAGTFTSLRSDTGLARQLAVETQHDIFSAYYHRLGRHISHLKDLYSFLSDQASKIMGNIFQMGGLEVSFVMNRNKSALRNVAVIATKRGQIAALDVDRQGIVVWKTEAKKLPFDIFWSVNEIRVHENIVIVRADKNETVQLNVFNGEILLHQPPAVDNKDVLNLTIESIQSHPSPRSEDAIPERMIYVSSNSSDCAAGWKIQDDQTPSQIWQFCPGDGQVISNLEHGVESEAIASIGRVLGDRNVLYKYLTPNLLLVTTAGWQRSSTSSYLLDSASGSIIHSRLLSDADLSRPVTAAVFENTVAVAICSNVSYQELLATGERRTNGCQLLLSELYESPFPNDRGPSKFVPPSRSEPTHNVPYVKTQIYQIPSSISHMSVTATLQGITPRSIICFLPLQNSLVAIPTALINPGNPAGRDPSSTEIEEGLMRLNPVLELDPKWTLNHRREFLDISNLVTHPSQFESTSLFLAFGDLDIFGTRISPIGGFDLLGKSFGKNQLIITVATLALGTIILAPMVRKRQIDNGWKS